MNVTIVDYKSGNISSVINSFKEVAKGKVKIEVTSDVSKIKSTDKVVLPGQGSFKSCVDALQSINGLVDCLNDFVMNKKKPLLGICVGLQMFADVGYEESETKGLGWIPGKVTKIDNQNGKYKLPHIGWNQINIVKGSKIFKDIKDKSHMYFVHSYEFVPITPFKQNSCSFFCNSLYKPFISSVYRVSVFYNNKRTGEYGFSR